MLKNLKKYSVAALSGAGAGVASWFSTLSAHAQSATSLFTLPDASTTINSSGVYSSAIFTSLLGLVYFIVGFTVGALIIVALIGAIIRAVKKVTGGGRSGKGGRGRRR